MPHEKSNLPQKITFTQPNGTENVFIRDEILGSGSFSDVYRVTHQNTNKIYAMKVISKENYSKSKSLLLDLENEIKIQKLVNHPNVVKSDFSFSDDQNHYFALEYCPGGNVREYLRKNKFYRLNEPDIRKIIKDVIQGLVYIHGLKIIHHDIKLENMVIGSSGNVKIADFGLSKFQKRGNENEKKSTIFGTLKYLCPEMIRRGSRTKSCKIDIWAVGVSAFFLLTGKYPFDGSSTEKIMKSIKKDELHFPLNFKISDEIKDFISLMLQKDPTKRPTARELLRHPFLKKINEETVCLYKPPTPKPPAIEKVEEMKRNIHKKQRKGKKAAQKQKNENLKPSFSPPLIDNKQISPRKPNEIMRPSLCPPLNDARPVSQRQQTGDLKPSLCPPLIDNKQISPRKPNENMNPTFYPPLNDARPVSQRQQAGDLKPSFCPPLCNNKFISPRSPAAGLKPALCLPLNNPRPVSQRQQTEDLKPTFCPPLIDSKQISPRKTNDNMNQHLYPPISVSRPVSQRQQEGDLKPTFCPPLIDNKQISPRKPSENMKPSLLPPLNSSRPVSQRQQTEDLKPTFCPPLNNNKQISPRKSNDNINQNLYPPISNSRPVSQRQQTEDLKPTFCPPLNNNNLISPRKPNENMKPTLYSPISSSKSISQKQQTGDLKPSFLPPLNDIKSPQKPNSSLRQARFPPVTDAVYSIFAYNNQSCIADFIIPSYFVSRFSFYKDDLSYLLFDGTVGFCFKDESRIVMEPNEQFAQFYKDSNTVFPDIIYLKNFDENNEPEKISILKKAAKNFKKIRFSYELEDMVYDPDFILHNINCFVKCDDSILFKLDGMNFQVNFQDHEKLIIFWDSKKLCFFRSFNEFCTLLDLKNVTSMNPDCDEFKKFEQAKILLSELSLSIC